LLGLAALSAVSESKEMFGRIARQAL